MNFEWDDDKSRACYQMRGFDFSYAAVISARKANPREVKRYENRSNED